MGNENYKKLGIIGGLGPAATATLFARVIDLTEAETDQDHLDITILNRPQTPDRTAFILGKSDESYLPPLHEAALELEDLGCEVLATPCVTGHYRSDEWSAGLQTAHLVHMPRETARYLALAGKRCVGIMATDGTGHARVLQNELEAYGLKAVLPDAENQAKVMSIIYDEIKRGEKGSREKFAAIDRWLRGSGCDAAILGCTELSVYRTYHGLPDYYLDAMEILAERCITACGYKLRMV